MSFAFHISREAQERYGVDDERLSTTGDAARADLAAGRRLAQRINQVREAAAAGDAGDGKREPVHAGQLTAMGLLHEILRRVAEMYRAEVNPGAMAAALAAVGQRVGADRLEATLAAFVAEFPTAEVRRGAISPQAYLDGQTDGVPNREIAVQELLLLWLANANPAFAPFEELFDDDALRDTAYPDVVAALIAFFGTQPAFGPESQTLVEMLRSPAVAVPDSIAGQLRYVRERWTALLGELMDRLIRDLDVLAEEELGIWQRFHPGPGGGAEDAARRAGKAWLTESGWYGKGAGESEEERFSVDRDWMPRLVLMAKSTYVWLDQLSKQYGRHIGRLDEIPDEELDRLARWGFTGLWLIGLWQRSDASQRIKVLRGNPEAVASAYSLDDYRIADDIGGEEAFDRLKSRCWTRGIRLASDMVPNHMGIDSRWVMEHPDWFISVPDAPYPAYTFSGPDLSHDPRVGIFLEDHYYDNTDAAVVFKRVDRWTGQEQYVYHGNDGTSMPWNDTAQLNYVREDVREAVIQTILAVARRSPVIRFDAAMTLAKRHIERLWFPEPGHGGGIPSRAEHAMPKEEFERLMPVEFWREVVDRVAREVPDTLLLAEAFWLMEGYFVRTLGMHRVYNSAFMNMLRDEQNANYRSVMKNTIEFDPEVLKRYVNFMNNPDEKSAVDQFGKGDKYFGIATVMATLPGLPMFGHGQIEGYAEKYGMEYRRAYWDEQPDRWLVERHEREIVPLLHRRALFADVDDFLLFDFVRDDGSVDEDVFAYSNRGGGERSLVVYLNRFASTSGRIRESAAFSARSDEGGRATTRRTLGDGLGLHREDDWFVAFADTRSGLEYLRSSRDVHEHGLHLALDAYSCRVYVGIREVQDSSGRPWGRLAAELGERGVPSLDESIREMLLRPVHEPLRRLLEPERLRRLVAAVEATDPEVISGLREDLAAALAAMGELVADGAATEAATDELTSELLAGLRAARGAPPTAGAPATAQPATAQLATVQPATRPGSTVMAPVAGAVPEPLIPAWLLFRGLPSALGQSVDAVRARAWIDDWRLGSVVAATLRAAGLAEADAWRGVAALKALLTLPPWPLDEPAEPRVAQILAAWIADDAVAQMLQVNTHRDVRWFNKEAFETFARWAAAIERIRASVPAATAIPDLSTAVARTLDDELAATVVALTDAAARAGYRFDALRSVATQAADPRIVRSA